ncbi:hypothetical protein [Reyranella sp.]|uniref:hypothetical protein n=1 Tax=Reyranella sp. TaxID=1929291 RepID=UPI003BAC734C
MRVIIRFSVDGEKNSVLRNKLVKSLTDVGFVRGKKTATFEHSTISAGNLGVALQDFYRLAQTHKGPGTLDHFWLYSDQT